MVGVVDYGAGNLRNVQAALGRLNVEWRCVTAPNDLLSVSRLILPGVGRFAAAMHQLREAGLVDPLREFAHSGRPFLGICLGMQLLFESSQEDVGVKGLGLFPGKVVRLESERLPHLGWALVAPSAAAAATSAQDGGSIFAGLPSRFHAYFAHSYVVPAATPQAAATTDCPPSFASAVRERAIWGVQFHPEKSGADGQRIIANFAGAAS